MRTLIYTRFSKDEDDEKATARQEKICRAFVKARDWAVAGIQTDRMSGWSRKERPGWLAVEQAVRSGEAEAVVVYSISRASRNLSRLVSFVELCEERGVAFESATEPIGGDFGAVMRAILGSLAELESQTKSRRAKDKVAEKVAEGTWHGKTPFGYRIVRRDGSATLEIVEREAAAIRTAAADVLNGRSLKAVARDWTEARFTTRGGRPWSGSRVREVLAAPRNVGFREHRGELVKARWDPILDRRTRDRLLALFTDPTRTARNPGEAYALTGLLYCAEHDRPLAGRPSHGDRFYICHHGRNSRHPKRMDGVHLRVRSEAVEEYVLRAADETTVPAVGVRDPRDVSAELLAARDDVDARISKWNRNAAAAGLSAAEIRDGRADLVAERERVERDIGAQASPATASWADVYPGTDDPRMFVAARVERVLVGPRTDHARPVDGDPATLGERLRIVWRDGVVAEPGVKPVGHNGQPRVPESH